MDRLHPGARWLFRIGGFFGAIIILGFLSGFFVSIIGAIIASMLGAGGLGPMFLLFIIFYIILAIIIAEIYARMAYNRWLYEFGPANLKLERGIIWKKYSNVPYERVQNIDIYRGILARILGFSTVDIQTAGFHGGYGRRGMPRSEGHIPAVSTEEAEKIRDFLMKKISKKQGGQGL